jgi:uncharacterized protein
MQDVGLDSGFAARVEEIIQEARTSRRHARISPEAMALSDGDTAFKALPTTPLMAADYMRETESSLRALARKIVDEQAPLNRQGIYFYSESARQAYGAWGSENLALWTRVLDSLDDSQVLCAIPASAVDST